MLIVRTDAHVRRSLLRLQLRITVIIMVRFIAAHLSLVCHAQLSLLEVYRLVERILIVDVGTEVTSYPFLLALEQILELVEGDGLLATLEVL